MPNIKSAKKRVKVIKAKTLINKNIRTNLKTVMKKADNAILNNDIDKKVIVVSAIKAIDKACAKGILHKNCASRKKSQLSKRVNSIKA